MKRFLLSSSSVLFFIVFWLGVSLLLNTPMLPSPVKVIRSLFTPTFSHPLFHLFPSLMRIAAGTVFAVLSGAFFGIAAARLRFADRILSPIFYLIYPVPKVVFIPPLMLLLGTGELSKIILIFLVVFFPVMITVRDSVKSIPEEYFVSYSSIGGGIRGEIFKLIIPASLPGILTSLRVTTGISAAVLFFIEYYGTEKGMGYYIMDAWLRFDFIDLYSGVSLLSFSILLIYLLIDLVEKRLCSWQE